MIRIFSKLVRKYNKNTKHIEWDLVSTKNPNKVLKWFGTVKPSKEKVLKEEKRIQWFKNKAYIKNSWLKEELPILPEKDVLSFTKFDVELSTKNLKNHNIQRKYIFGPQEISDFGSGLYKKDKELFPKWEFTENPQFKEKLGSLLDKLIEVEIYPELKQWINFANSIIERCREARILLKKIIFSIETSKYVIPNYKESLSNFFNFILEQKKEIDNLDNFLLKKFLKYIDKIQNEINKIEEIQEDEQSRIHELEPEIKGPYELRPIYPSHYVEQAEELLYTETLYPQLDQIEAYKSSLKDLKNYYEIVWRRLYNLKEKLNYSFSPSFLKYILSELHQINSYTSDENIRDLKNNLEGLLEDVEYLANISQTKLEGIY